MKKSKAKGKTIKAWAVAGMETNILNARIVLGGMKECYLIFPKKEEAISACETEIGEKVIPITIKGRW